MSLIKIAGPRRNSSGFTLLENVLVFVIIGLSAALVAPKINHAIKEKEFDINFNQFLEDIAFYQEKAINEQVELTIYFTGGAHFANGFNVYLGKDLTKEPIDKKMIGENFRFAHYGVRYLYIKSDGKAKLGTKVYNSTTHFLMTNKKDITMWNAKPADYIAYRMIIFKNSTGTIIPGDRLFEGQGN